MRPSKFTGSGQDGMAGAAVKALHYQLGLLEWHTTYEAELVGMLLDMWMVGHKTEVSIASIKADSQAAIQVLHAHRAGPGSYLLDEICELSTSLHAQSLSDLQLKISWVSGHDGVAGNKRADTEAKAAATSDSSAELE